MKKMTRILSLLLAVTLLLSVTALAADTAPTIEKKDKGATVEFNDGNQSLNVTYKNEAIQQGGQYLILVVKCDKDGTATISENTILYINQLPADVAGTVSFEGDEYKVYPSSIQNSVIMLAGTGLDEPVPLATISVPYTLGDLDEDGKILATDGVAMSKHLAGIEILQGNSYLAGDIDRDGKITAVDGVMLRQYLAGIITEF